MSGTAFPFPCSTHVKLSSNKEDLASLRCTQESWGEGKPTSASVYRLMQAHLLCKLLHCKGQGTTLPGRTPVSHPQEATQQTPEHEPTTDQKPNTNPPLKKPQWSHKPKIHKASMLCRGLPLLVFLFLFLPSWDRNPLKNVLFALQCLPSTKTWEWTWSCIFWNVVRVCTRMDMKYQKKMLHNFTLLHRPRVSLWKLPWRGAALRGEVFVMVADSKAEHL